MFRICATLAAIAALTASASADNCRHVVQTQAIVVATPAVAVATIVTPFIVTAYVGIPTYAVTNGYGGYSNQAAPQCTDGAEVKQLRADLASTKADIASTKSDVAAIAAFVRQLPQTIPQPVPQPLPAGPPLAPPPLASPRAEVAPPPVKTSGVSPFLANCAQCHNDSVAASKGGGHAFFVDGKERPLSCDEAVSIYEALEDGSMPKGRKIDDQTIADINARVRDLRKAGKVAAAK